MYLPTVFVSGVMVGGDGGVGWPGGTSRANAHGACAATSAVTESE